MQHSRRSGVVDKVTANLAAKIDANRLKALRDTLVEFNCDGAPRSPNEIDADRSGL